MPGLFIDIEARFAKFEDALSRIEQGTRNTTQRIEQAFGNVRSAVLALAPALSAAGFATWLKGAIDAQDELGKLAQRVGVSVEALSALQYAGRLADVSTEQLATGLRHLARNAQDTAAGAGEAKEAFAALGIRVTDATGRLRSTEEILADVAERFARMEDGAGKTALAMRLFGRSGADLIPLLNAGRDGLAQMRDEAERLGLVVDKDAAQAAERFNDNLTRLKASSEALAIRLGNILLPTLIDLTERLVEAQRAGDGFFARLNALANLPHFGDTTSEQLRTIREELERTDRLFARFGGVPGVREILGVRGGNLLAAERAALAEQRREALALLGEGFDDRELRRAGAVPLRLPAPLLPDLEAEKQRVDERRKLLEQDIKGWVAHAEEIFRIADEENLALARINEAFFQEQERLKQEDIKGWIAHAEEIFRIADEENLALARIREEAEKNNDVARELGLTFSSAFEDAIVQGRKLSDVLRGLAQDVTRLFVRRTAVEPLAKAAEGFFGSLLSGFFHSGGVVGVDSAPTRAVPALAFANAPRLHSGGILASDEVPAILRRGEAVFTPAQLRALRGGTTVNVINNTPAQVRTQKREDSGERVIDVIIDQVTGLMGRDIARGAGLAPLLERRYGLTPAAGALR